MAAAPSLSVRPERPEDADAVWTVHEAAFGRPDEARLVARLRRAAEPGVSIVAERGGRVLGHVFCSPVRIDADGETPRAAGLAPLGVLPAAQGRGVGGALVRSAIDATRGLGFELLVLLGDPAYYGRFGFTAAAPFGLHYRSHAFDGAFQALDLVAGAHARARGWVHYHPAFAEAHG